MVKKCKGWREYRALRTPRCMNGEQCQYCTSLWQARLDNNGYPLSDEQLDFHRKNWESSLSKEEKERLLYNEYAIRRRQEADLAEDSYLKEWENEHKTL